MRRHRIVHLNQAAEQLIPLTEKMVSWGREGGATQGGGIQQRDLEDSSGATLKSPMRTTECLSGRHSQSSPPFSICMMR